MNQPIVNPKRSMQKVTKNDVGNTIISEAQQYITRRVLDACLRENVRDIFKYGEIISGNAISRLLIAWPYAKPEQWLSITHLGDFTLYLPLEKSLFIQPWKVSVPAWLVFENEHLYIAQGYQDWLMLLSRDLTEEQQGYYDIYIKECDCAVDHRAIAKQIFETQQDKLNQEIFNNTDSWQQLSFTEQLAAHLDHPLYPTARAKFGLDEKGVEAYCPEAMAEFSLNWLAVPKTLHISSVPTPPAQWPNFEQVGLHASLAESHQLVPVHPLMFNQYIIKKLNDWSHKADIHFAPLSYLKVRPTLSVRTVLLLEEPNIHIKLPLPMHTLGSKNIRTIKPSTITDGFVFQQILQHLAMHDEHLKDHYLHSHEQQGGHVDQRADLAWLIREYPGEVSSTAPVCVAAFMAENPDGTLVIEQLAKHFYQSDLAKLLDDYFGLLLNVHLRLWLVYGITLEANQQNCLVLFHENKPLKLLFRDNDSGRIYPRRLLQECPSLQNKLAQFIDARMFVDDDVPLLQMFTTIILQLNMTCLIHELLIRNLVNETETYQLLQKKFQQALSQLNTQDVETAYVEKHLIKAPLHYVKCLLSAGSLLSKKDSGAASINKFYGLGAINPLMPQAASEVNND
ncbi:IucA/IucC family protein [Thalassotalea ganghwensis]